MITAGSFACIFMNSMIIYGQHDDNSRSSVRYRKTGNTESTSREPDRSGWGHLAVRRPYLAFILILAFTVALVAPVRAAWVCQDGTPCVVAPGSKAAGPESEASCCARVAVEACRHGAEAPVAEAASPMLGHCRYSVSAAPDLAALVPTGSLIEDLCVAALPLAAPLPELVLDAFTFAGWPEETDHRPPPVALERPSRAPPTS